MTFHTFKKNTEMIYLPDPLATAPQKLTEHDEVRETGVDKEYFSTPHGSVLLPVTTQ